MAYNFTSANSQRLTTPSVPVSTAPFTISAFGTINTIGGVKTLVSIESGNSNILHQLFIDGAQRPSFYSEGLSGVSYCIIASPLATVGSVFHILGVVNSQSSRSVYFNGSTSNTNVTNTGTTPVTRINIGSRYYAGSLGGYQNGLISEVGIWNQALTVEEILSLSKGMTCDKVRPQNLVFYAPLVRDLIDQKGLTITNNNGATVANHPRVYA